MKKPYIIDLSMPYQKRWLLYVMNLNGINMSELAKKLHISRQYVDLMVRTDTKLKFPYIAAICCVLNLPEDPEDVYQNIQKDRNRNNANNDGVN